MESAAMVAQRKAKLFIGIPKERSTEEGVSYIDLVRPLEFQLDQIEALFFDEFNRCIVADTLIPLADGTKVAVKDLVGKDCFYVYSYDVSAKRVVLGRGHSARITGCQQKILRVELDNGKSIRCTPDHPFLMRDGSYREAKDLLPNDSLMPLYTRLSDGRACIRGYEQVFQVETNRWHFTHWLADDYNVSHGVYNVDRGVIRHHKDFHKLNNSPKNIERLDKLEHMNLHNLCAVSRENCSKGGKATHKKHPDLYASTIGTKRSKKKALINSVATRSTSLAYKLLRSQISKSYFDADARKDQSVRCSHGWDSGQFDFDQKEAHHKRAASIAICFGRKVIDSGLPLTPEIYAEERAKIKGRGKTPARVENLVNYFATFDDYKVAVGVGGNNHKVVSVIEDGCEDVYDITVDEYHNFAVDAGVFVHNSHKKVRNAVMELMQFKSINGKKFKNLRIVWAAINPEDEDEYDVERLDPAQKDRFHISLDIPYKPDLDYFTRVYSEDTARAAISWWNELPDEIKAA